MPHPQRILLIDDDTDHLDLCKLILQRNGYEVETLSDYIQVMQTVARFNPELIFVDHYMKEVNGIQVTRMLKSHPDSKRIPVIYFSSCSDIVKRTEEAGADGYLEKPFAFASLIDIARKYLAKAYCF